MLHNNRKQQKLQAQIDRDTADFIASGGKVTVIGFGVSGIDLETGLPLKKLPESARERQHIRGSRSMDVRTRRREYNKDLLVRSEL